MSLLHLVILAPFLFAILIPFFYKYLRSIHTGWFVLIIPVVLFTYLAKFLPGLGTGEPIIKTLPWVPSLGINFNVYVDGLGLLFALLITGIGALVVLYSIYYLQKEKEALHNFYVYLLMFMGAMLGIVLSDNLIVLYVFWELTSLSSSLLIGYWYTREKSRYGAQKSMLITVTGGFAMLAGFTLLYVMSGASGLAETFSIRELIERSDMIMNEALFVPAMILVLLGAFTKSAQFPFHIWLPDAMEAPTPVSAYLHSATMVKAGIYLVARMTPLFAGAAEWFWIVSGVGLVTLFYGSYTAVKQTDLKSILAFSTISQLGLIMCLLGIGSAAVHYDYFTETQMYTTATLTAIFHLINHATFKGSLFMAAGIIDHETGTRDIRKLGGLMTIMPITFTITLIGSFSMAGLPPFNGFLSKEMFFTSLLRVNEIGVFNAETIGIVFPIVGWIASVFTFLYCMILLFKTFGGNLQPEKLDVKPHEAPIGMLISPIILASLVIIIFIFPNMLSYILEPTMHSILPIIEPDQSFNVQIDRWHGFNTELMMTFGVVLAGALIYRRLSNWKDMYSKITQRDPINNVYDHSLVGLIKGSQYVTRMQMTGLLRDYFAYMAVFMIFLITYSMVKYNAFGIDLASAAAIPAYVWVLAFVFIAATLSVPFIPHRITAIIAVGVTGYLLALFFTIFHAPDLALTQLLIETVMVVLLLLCFYHLPELRKETFTPVFKSVNLVISISVGVLVTIIAFSSLSLGQKVGFEPISQYFVENSYALAGGKNMVNVILVDFRGLDTILEVLVLGIAALGVISLIKLRMSGREDV